MVDTFINRVACVVRDLLDAAAEAVQALGRAAHEKERAALDHRPSFEAIALALVEECRSPVLAESPLLAAHPDYTVKVLQMGMEIMYSAGRSSKRGLTDKIEALSPEEFRRVVAGLIREASGGSA